MENQGDILKKVTHFSASNCPKVVYLGSYQNYFIGLHYANMSVQYTAIFHGCKNDNFQMKFFYIFLIFAQNIDCGYTLEPPQRGGSNEYPQSMFWSKNKKNMFTRVNLTFST